MYVYVDGGINNRNLKSPPVILDKSRPWPMEVTTQVAKKLGEK